MFDLAPLKRKFVMRRKSAVVVLGVVLSLCALTAPGQAGTAQKVAKLQAQIAALQTQVATLQIQMTSLLKYITVDEADTIKGLRPPHLIFHGVNVHVESGSGVTVDKTGLGNLVVGYDSDSDLTTGVPNACFDSTAAIDGARTGSNNLIVGDCHGFTASGGLATGFNNKVTAIFSTVDGGENNTASGRSSSVSGGGFNTASGELSSVSGGVTNTAFGFVSSVSGGQNNLASGRSSSVSGGSFNTASGSLSGISGGENNTASGGFSSILGDNGVTVSTADGHFP